MPGPWQGPVAAQPASPGALSHGDLGAHLSLPPGLLGVPRPDLRFYRRFSPGFGGLAAKHRPQQPRQQGRVGRVQLLRGQKPPCPGCVTAEDASLPLSECQPPTGASHPAACRWTHHRAGETLGTRGNFLSAF